MFDAKEQIKLYVDAIKAALKSANNFFLIFLPILAFFLLENKKHSHEIEKLVSVRTNLINLKKEQDTLRDKIRKVDSIYNSGYFAEYISGLESKEKGAKAEQFYKERDSLQNRAVRILSKLKPQIRSANDSLQTQLDNLKIPVELPLIKRTEELSIKALYLSTMLLVFFFMLYMYRSKRRISNLICKIWLIEARATVTPAIYKDYGIQFSFWMFPTVMRINDANNKYDITQFLQLSKPRLKTYNWLMVAFWLIILLASAFLWYVNWDVNFKIFHHSYSFYIVLSNLLFLGISYLFICLVKPAFVAEVCSIQQEPEKKSGVSRSTFLKLGIGLATGLLLEPLAGLGGKSKKWFQTPRFRKNRNKSFIPRIEGLYINNTYRKRSKAYYFSAGNYRRIFNTIPDGKYFSSTLRPVSYTVLFKQPALITSISEPDVLLVVKNLRLENKAGQRVRGMIPTALVDSEKFRLLDLYVKNNFDRGCSSQLIDQYTRLYKSVDKKTKAKSHVHLIEQRIADIRSKPENELPKKYSDKTKPGNNEYKYSQTRDSLLAQIDIRSKKWLKRLT